MQRPRLRRDGVAPPPWVPSAGVPSWHGHRPDRRNDRAELDAYGRRNLRQRSPAERSGGVRSRGGGECVPQSALRIQLLPPVGLRSRAARSHSPASATPHSPTDAQNRANCSLSLPSVASAQLKPRNVAVQARLSSPAVTSHPAPTYAPPMIVRARLSEA